MGLRKLAVLGCIMILATACSREGDDTPQEDSVLPLTIDLTRDRAVTEALEGSNSTYSQTIEMTLNGLQGQPYFIVDSDNAPSLESLQLSEFSTSTSSLEIQFDWIDISQLAPGTHFGEVKVHICASVACEQRYEGSPVTIEVITTVTPKTVIDTSCPDEPGVIFNDCVDPSWSVPYGWQWDNDNQIGYRYFNNNGSLMVDWSIIDAVDINGQSSTIIDVNYTAETNSRGQLNFSPAYYLDEGNTYDMSAFADGSLVFDLKVLSWGEHPQALNIDVECGWPCGAGRIPLDITETNTWLHFEFTVEELVNLGLDLEHIHTGFIIAANAGTPAKGLHFQLNNIRWTGGIEATNSPEIGVLSVPYTTRAITTSPNDTRNFVWLFEAEVPSVSTPVYYVINEGNSQIIESSFSTPTGEGNAAQIIIDPVDPLFVTQSTSKEFIELKACMDIDCTEEYPNSPVTLELIYTVLPTQNSTPECGSAEPGDIFIDCIGQHWLDISAWEGRSMNGQTISYRTFDGTGNFEASWQIIDSGMPEHNQIIDIRHADNGLANDTIQFAAAETQLNAPLDNTRSLDLSDYANGILEFDLNVIDWGQSAPYMEIKAECDWPCTSGYTRIENIELNKWTHYSIDAIDLIESGLDISKVDKGLTIRPEEFNSNGAHYQLDNIRWVK